jgi:thiol-disulfide isomerase/thioredoxin
MKNSIISLIVIFLMLLVSGCNTLRNPEIPKFSFNEESYLLFHVTNCKTPTNFLLVYNTIFPFEQTTENIYFEQDTTEIIKLLVNHPVTVNFIATNSYARFYALPKDTLEIWLDLNDLKTFTDRITFKGKTASISDYLTSFKINISSVPGSGESVNEYNNRVDTLTEKGLQALYTFNRSKILPEWFIKQEEIDIRYTGANDKISQFSNSFLWYNKFRPRTDNFVDHLNIKIDNPEAKFSESYYSFLCMNCPEQYDTLLTPQNRTSEIFFKFIEENLITAQNKLHSEIKDVFIAQRICSYLSIRAISDALTFSDSGYFRRVDTLLTYAKVNLTDTAILSVLLSYHKDQFINANSSVSLKPGTKAPDFKLTDLTGQIKSLSDFKGQFVVINFWATWCSPCIKSIPEKNKLYQEYFNKGIVLLNVCIDPEKVKWRELIKENNFQGVHLICNGDWIDIIRKSYFINTIPHYTLVNKDGEIIKNRVANITELDALIKNQI